MGKVSPHSQSLTLRSLDGRGCLAREMRRVRAEIVDQLGGEDAVTATQTLVIEGLVVRVLRARLLLAGLMSGETDAAESERRLGWHLNGITRACAVLGLERRGPELPSLSEYLGQRTSTESRAA